MSVTRTFGKKATRPCPCGFLGDSTDRCRCGAARIHQYRNRISGPLLDRFDLHIEVPRVAFAELAENPAEQGATVLKAAVLRARERQLKRGALNALLGERAVFEQISPDREARRILSKATERWQLSARSVVRILKVSKTLADLEASAEPGARHVAEALQLRRLDRPLGTDTL